MSADLLAQIEEEDALLQGLLPYRTAQHIRDIEGCTDGLRDSLVRAMQLIVAYCVRKAIGPVITRAQIGEALQGKRRYSAPTIVRYLERLTAIGELRKIARHTYRVRELAGTLGDGQRLTLPLNAAFWGEYKAYREGRQRRMDAQRKRTKRSLRAPKTAAIAAESADVRPYLLSAAAPPAAAAPADKSFSGRMRPQKTQPEASKPAIPSATLDALDEELIAAVLPSTAEPAVPAAPGFVVADAPLEKPQEQVDPEVAAFMARCLARAASAAPEPATAPALPKTKPAPKAAPKPKHKPAMAAQDLVQLADEHGLALGTGPGQINAVAILHSGAPRSLVQQAFGVLRDAQRDDEGRRRDKRAGLAPVRSPGAFLLGTVRHLMLHPANGFN